MRRPLSVRFTAEARSDIAAIHDRIAGDDPAAADAVTFAIDDAVERLRFFPFKARKTKRRSVRALPLSRYPYLVFYKIARGELIVLYVHHGARRHPGFQERAVEFEC